MDDNLIQAARLIQNSKRCTAFTGAGISVESGIPPFRGENGIWNKYDPGILDIENFYRHPEESWVAIKEIFYDFYGAVKPNPAHLVLARWEQEGIIKGIITQNIDNLHQEAGSKTVWEFHGNYNRMICTHCGKVYIPGEHTFDRLPPRCSADGTILKPDFVFFGEMIPEKASAGAFREAELADLFILIGTTGEVAPANMIPQAAKRNKAKIIEINTSPSHYTKNITDIFLQGKAGEIMTKLDELVTYQNKIKQQ